MKLSEAQRLILSTNFRIIQLLTKDEDERAECQAKITVLENGFEKEFESLPELLTVEECSEVREIMEMYADLKFWHEKLGKPLEVKESEVQFEGFDYREFERQQNYAKYLATSDFNGFKISNNSVMSLDTTRRMLKVWKKLKREKLDAGGEFGFTTANLRKILNMRIHPDNR